MLPQKFSGYPFEDTHLSRVFRDLLRAFDENATISSSWIPPCDIVEKEDKLELTMELPGLMKEQVQIEVNNHVLTVKGERKELKEMKEGRTHRQERTFGSFERSFTLPSSTDPARIQAAFQNGILTLSIPKMETARPRKIQIAG